MSNDELKLVEDVLDRFVKRTIEQRDVLIAEWQGEEPQPHTPDTCLPTTISILNTVASLTRAIVKTVRDLRTDV